MKKIFAVLLGCCLLFSTVSCKTGTDEIPEENPLEWSYNQNGVDPSTVSVDSGLRLQVNNRGNDRTVHGFGAEFDPFLNLKNYPDLTQADIDADLAKLKKIMQDVNVQIVRIWVEPGWFEPVNDNADPNSSDESRFFVDESGVLSTEMAAFYGQLQLCQELGIDVNVTWWTAATNDSRSSWLASKNSGQWCSMPNDMDEFAENFVSLLKYLDKKYPCVKECTAVNEPDWAMLNDSGKVVFEKYVEMYVKLDERMKRENIRDRYLINGSDDASNAIWLNQCVQNQTLNEIVDIYSSHSYLHSNENSNAEINGKFEQISEVVHDKNPKKQIYFTEYGTSNVLPPYDGTDLDTFERGLFMGRSAIMALNNGIGGISHWTMHDVTYPGGSEMLLGLLQDRHQNFAPKKPFFAYGLVMRFTDVGSAVFPIETGTAQPIQAVAVKNREGKFTYLVCNTGLLPQKVCFVNTHRPEMTFHHYVYHSSISLPEEGEYLLPSTKTSSAEHYVFAETIAANSFAVFTEL